MDKRKLGLTKLIKESYEYKKKSEIYLKDKISARHRPSSSMQSGKQDVFSNENPNDAGKFVSIDLKQGPNIKTGKDNCKSSSNICVVPVKTANFFGKTGFGSFRDLRSRNTHSMKNLIIQFNSRIVNQRKRRVYFNSLRLNDLETFGNLNKGKPKGRLDIFIVSQRNPKTHLNSY